MGGPEIQCKKHFVSLWYLEQNDAILQKMQIRVILGTWEMAKNGKLFFFKAIRIDDR